MGNKNKQSFRLLELEEEFFEYLKNENLLPTEAIRNFIKNGMRGGGGLSVNEKSVLKKELVEINKQLRAVGINLNQISRKYHQENKLTENNLINSQKVLTDRIEVLRKILNKLLANI